MTKSGHREYSIEQMNFYSRFALLMKSPNASNAIELLPKAIPTTNISTHNNGLMSSVDSLCHIIITTLSALYALIRFKCTEIASSAEITNCKW